MHRMITLKQQAKAAGLTQREIASALGVGEPAVSMWFSRTAGIPVRHLTPLADLLKVPLADVVAQACPMKDDA